MVYSYLKLVPTKDYLILRALANGRIIQAVIKSDIRNIVMTKIFVVSIEAFPRALPSSSTLYVNILSYVGK